MTHDNANLIDDKLFNDEIMFSALNIGTFKYKLHFYLPLKFYKQQL